eukprot:6195599-Pleurochrysis_carterae.AAC.2
MRILKTACFDRLPRWLSSVLLIPRTNQTKAGRAQSKDNTHRVSEAERRNVQHVIVLSQPQRPRP